MDNRLAYLDYNATTPVKPEVLARVAEALVIGGNPSEIGEDLGLRGVGPRPVGVLVERIGIEVRRHVAGASRVGVVSPSATERRGLFEDPKIRAALLLQLDRHANAGEPGAENGDADFRLDERRV